MFIKSIYKVLERKDLKITYSAKVKIEDLWVEITNDNGEKYVIYLIYHHPGGDVKQFTEQLENTLSKIENDKTIKHNIITGDFKIDLIKFHLNDNKNKYLNTILKNEFIPTILLSTGVMSHTCTLIDHIYHQSINSRIQILSENLMTDMSDHFANFISLHSKNKNIAVDRPMVFSDKNKTIF